MAHIPTTESDDQKVFRIARVLDISLEDAALTCAGFELAFSDDRMRRAIFEIVDQLDYEAYKKGEPLGMILSYAVELGIDGIHVTRHANEIPPGEVVSLTPTNRAMIFVKIKDNFPTQQFLGPLIVNRPDLMSEPGSRGFSTGQSCWPEPTGLFSDESEIANPESGISSEVVCSDSEMKESAILLGPSSLELAGEPICLGPIRLKFNERFPCVLATRSSSQRAVLQAGNPAFQSKALKPSHHLPPWAAFADRMPAFQSGLSPPLHTEKLGHSERKMFLRPLANRRRDACVSHLDL